MRILAACSMGGAGHLNPLLPLMAAARRRGDEVLVIGPPSLGELVERSGFPFVGGGEPPEDRVAPIRERLPVAPPQEASILGNRELFGRLAAAAMIPAMDRTCSHWRPDLVLRDPCEYASAAVASRIGIRTVHVAISLADVESASIDAAAPALDEHRTGLAQELRTRPYVTRFPAALDPSPFPSTIRFHDPDRSCATPLEDWWGSSDEPLVYLTFGTVMGHMTMAGDVYRTALRAVADLDARVLLTVGRRFDATMLGAIADNVHVEPWIDQAEVLDRADVVVCHGGSGTVLGALAAGVPMVVVPLFADQFENARRIATAGAGLIVESERSAEGSRRNFIGDEDAAQLTKAINAVLATSSYREQAGRIAAEMAVAPTAGEVLDGLATAQ
jgi:UDP:flavonoid glycosyltransferase YjiC (YdhE family)